jgi:uncharacterized BrkB/YihY/UPF0761 family membrane protein
MDGYTVLAGALIFFLLFIYLTWFGVSIKIESQKEDQGPAQGPQKEIQKGCRFRQERG